MIFLRFISNLNNEIGDIWFNSSNRIATQSIGIGEGRIDQV